MEIFKKLFVRFRRAISFGAIGLINTGLDFLVFTISRSALGLTPYVSQAAGYIAGTICSFILNRTITFRDWTRALALQIALFVFVNAVSFAVSTNLIELFTVWGMNDYIAKGLVTGITMLINYFGYKKLVFKVTSSENQKG